MMKKIFLLVTFFVLGKMWSYAQYPLTQTLGSDSTIVISKGALQSRLINVTYTDTAAANLQRIRQYPGAQIATTTGGLNLWVRNANATAWIPVATGSGNNIYTIDGTLLGNRTLTGAGYSLTFNQLSKLLFNADSTTINTDQATILNNGVSTLSVKGATGRMFLVDTTAPADERIYELKSSNGEFFISILNDAQTSNDSAFLITSASRVGINTLNPDSALKVGGGVNIVGGLRVGNLPTSPGTKQLRINAQGQISLTDTLIDAGGTVTSIATNDGSGITGGTITTTGTLAIDTTNVIATKASVSGGLAGKLNISDTAAMLAPYLRAIDTASLSNRINTKLNISDTATMLGNYLNNAGYGLSKAGQVVSADSATLSAYYLRRKDSLTVTNPLGYVTQTILADTAAAIRGAAVTGFVPYVGATQNVDLGQFGLKTKYVEFDTSSQAVVDRRLQWSNDEGTLQFGMTNGATITQRVGLEQFARVKNVDAVQINKGEAVYIFGASGDRASVKLADNRADSTSSKTLGVAAEDIPINDVGLVGTFGQVGNLNLSTFSPGDILYLDSIPGQLTATKPQAPYHLVFIGVVERANSGNGLLFVNPQNGYELEELHNVRITSPVPNKAILLYDSVARLWVDTTVAASGIAVTQVNTNSATGITGGPITTTGTISADTLLLSTRAWRQKGIDSVAALANSKINGSLISGYLTKATGTLTIDTSQLYQSSGLIGIGTTSPTQKLQVSGNAFVNGQLFAGDTALSTYQVEGILTTPYVLGRKAVDNTISTEARPTGIQGHVVGRGSIANRLQGGTFYATTDSASTANSTGSLRATTSWAAHNGSGSLANAWGSYNIVSNKTTGTITNAYGSVSGVENRGATSTINKLQGNTTEVWNNYGGTIDTAWGQVISIYNNNAASNIGAVYGLSIGRGLITPTGGTHFWRNLGTIGSSYGIYLDSSIDVGATKYALFSNSNSNSYFKAKLGVGTTSPDSAFQVATGAYFQRGIRASGLPQAPGTKALRIDASGTISYADTLVDAGGTVTSVATNNGTGITGGTITTTGTLAIDTLLISTRAWRQKGIDSVAALINSNVSGTTNYVAKFTGTNSIGNSQIFDNGTNVGIGTATPANKLDVIGNINITNGNNGVLYFFNGATPLGGIGLQGWSGLGSTNDMTVGTVSSNNLVFQTINTERMRLTSAGNLGIGTSSPSEKLEVNGAIRATGAVTNNATGAILSYQGSSGSLLGAWGEDASTRGFITFYLANSTGTTGFAAMRLNQTGLGIGTTSPASTLHVVGSESRFGGVASGYISVYNATGRSGYLQANGGTDFRIASDTDPMTYYVNGSERMRLDASGNLGLGIVPSATVGGKSINIGAQGYAFSDGVSYQYNSGFANNAYVNGNGTYAAIVSRAAGILEINESSFIWKQASSGTAGSTLSLTSAMTLDASGNLGVGQTSIVSTDRTSITVTPTSPTSGSPANSSSLSIRGGTTTVGNGPLLTLINVSGAKETVWKLSAVTTSGNNGDLVFNGYAGGSDFPERMRITSAGLVGIGTSSPDSMLTVTQGAYLQRGVRLSGLPTGAGTKELRIDANGVVYANDTLSNDIAGSGTTNYIPKFTGSTSIGNSAIYDASGSIGIGYTTPLGPLDVRSTGTAQIYFGYPNAGEYGYLGRDANTGIYSLNIVQNANLTFGTNNSERMRLDASGNLLVGGSSGDGKLYVQTSSAVAYSSTVYNGTNANIRLKSGGSPTTNTTTGIAFGIGGNAEAYFGAVQNSSSYADFVFQTFNGSAYGTRMTLDASGNLGLGVTPSAWGTFSNVLELNGGVSIGGLGNIVYTAANAYFNGGWIYKANGTAGLQETGSTFKWFIAPSGTAGNAISFTQAMTLDASGRLGIGTTSPANLLHLAGASATPSLRLGSTSLGYYWDIGRENATTGDFVFNNASGGASSERMRITSGGNVGIGTSSPATKLQVVNAGDIAIIGDGNDNYFGNYTSGDYFDIGNLGSTGNVFLEGRGVSTNINSQYRTKGSGSHIWSYNAGGNEIMRTTSSGRLLIGTTSDAGDYKLQVNGNGYFGGNGVTLGDLRYATTGYITYDVNNTGTSSLVFRNYATPSLTLTSANNAEFGGSIKTAAPSGGTAQPWKLGSAGVTLGGSNLSGVEVEINGTTYYLVTGYLPEPEPDPAALPASGPSGSYKTYNKPTPVKSAQDAKIQALERELAELKEMVKKLASK